VKFSGIIIVNYLYLWEEAMLKAIIADDEHYVCQLIYKLIDWKELNIEIIGTVDNGI
jgi:hypothetical protein